MTGSTVVTGAGGFLGWHTRARARALTGSTPLSLALGVGYDADDAIHLVGGADHVVHIAGVNRGTDDEVRDGNIAAAHRLADAMRAADTPPGTVTNANSTQVGNGSVYGEAKREAAAIIEKACDELGVRFRDVSLPNLFGEHGAPFYNSVVATFCHLAAQGQPLRVDQDKELTLLHAQRAAELLLDPTRSAEVTEGAGVHRRTVLDLKAGIEELSAVYARGDIPNLVSAFDIELFNTYRSFTFPQHAPIRLTKRSDDRGSLSETVRSYGGQGHTFFSTTHPGITRGQHHHLRKFERFVVLAGSAQISLRRVLTDEVVTFDVNGDEPVAVDMPTMWAHKITNTGSDTLYTQFWANEIFDPEDPDTHPEEV